MTAIMVLIMVYLWGEFSEYTEGGFPPDLQFLWHCCKDTFAICNRLLELLQSLGTDLVCIYQTEKVYLLYIILIFFEKKS